MVIVKFKQIVFLVLCFLFFSVPVGADTLSFETDSVGASESIQMLDLPQYGEHISFQHAIDFKINPIGTTKVSAATIILQGSPDNVGANNQAITNPNIGVGSTAENFSNDLFYYRISSVNYTAIASALGNSFTYSHKVGPSGYGAIAIYVDDSGLYSTKIYGTSQIDTMSYTTPLRALNSLDSSSVSVSGAIRAGIVLIENNVTTWDAITDDLTNGSDVTTATFYSDTSSFTSITEYSLITTDIALQKGTFYVGDNLPAKYFRLFLSSLTGMGTFEITDKIMINGGHR